MLQDLIESNAKELDIQNYLSHHEEILIASIGQPFWFNNIVLSQFHFDPGGGVPDFLVIAGQSYTYEIHIVEIKLPSLKIFNKDCSLNSEVNKAVCQAHRYKTWIEKNMDYFKRILLSTILGKYPDFDDDFDYKEIKVSIDIVAGRREKSDSDKSSAIQSLNARVMSYDRLIGAEKRLEEMREKNVPFYLYDSDFQIAAKCDGCKLKNKIIRD